MSRIDETRRQEQRQLEAQQLTRREFDSKKHSLFQQALVSKKVVSVKPLVKIQPTKFHNSTRSPLLVRLLENQQPSMPRKDLRDKSSPNKVAMRNSDTSPVLEKVTIDRPELLYAAAIKRGDNHGSQSNFQGPPQHFVPIVPKSIAGEVSELTRQIIDKMVTSLQTGPLQGFSSLTIDLGLELGGGSVKVCTNTENKISLEFKGLTNALAESLQANYHELRRRLAHRGHHLGCVNFAA